MELLSDMTQEASESRRATSRNGTKIPQNLHGTVVTTPLYCVAVWPWPCALQPAPLSFVLFSSIQRHTMSGRQRTQRGCITLQPPRMMPDGLEVSLHTCPRALLRELDHVFPGVDLNDCLAIPTNQKAVMDLVAMGDTVETEKDVLLNSFASFASGVCKQIREAGYWADYIDPCSGLP
ncbi:unnamed protein product, partial [Ectocarpus sp. 12 AP-2014]